MNKPVMIQRGGAWLRLLRDQLYDARRFFRHSASRSVRFSDGQLRARLLQKAHSIEKGLSMPTVRGGFGAAALRELRGLIAEHQARGLDPAERGYRKARHAIAAYVAFHEQAGAAIPEPLGFVHDLAEPLHDASAGGVDMIDRAEIARLSRADFAGLVRARRSSRTFAPTPVDPALVRQAVGLALWSPSVCNRQSARVHIVDEPALLARVLKVQGGNRGFDDQVAAVLVVTSYLGSFMGARERNQGWVDGGMFAMSLLYGLTYVGLGSCPLNWSARAEQDKAFRDVLPIPDDESVVMLIAIGNLPDTFRAPVSPRLDVDTVLGHIGAVA